MVEVYLIITGIIFFAWLYALVRQTQRGYAAPQPDSLRPVVPVNLFEGDDAVVVAEGRGRIVYANDSARQWFGIDGGAPNLALMSQQIYPRDALHDLVAGSGHATFRLGQRQIEAVSHSIPGPGGQRMVVVMREMTSRALPTYTEFDPLRALAIVSEISHTAGVTLDLNTMLNAILRSLEPAIAYDGAEIALWDAATGTLRSAARSAVRAPTGALIPPGNRPDTVYRPGEGYSGWIAMYRQPLLIDDVTARTDVQPVSLQARFASYAGVPLMAGDQFIGILELVHHKPGAFTQRDIALLQSISSQAGAAVQAAQRYQEQSARVTELGGLQQIADAMSQLGEPEEIYGQLTQRIAALMDVELCGVLLYDEDEQTFRSQPPFYGVPDSLIVHYRLALIPGTELADIWEHQASWYTNDPESAVIEALGFDDLRSAVALNAVGLVPMVAGARRTGLLLVANKHGPGGLTEADMRALMSFASQAAVVTENARLYAEQQRRARELGGLQQIAQAIGVMRSPAELTSQITARIAALMQVDLCGVLLYDHQDRLLVSQMPFYGMDDTESVNFYQIPSPPGGPMAQLWQERDTWFSNDLRRDPRVANTDLAHLAAAVGIRQMTMATLVVGGNRLGVIQVANKTDGSDFTEDDARLLSIFAGQAAILIDNARLYREMQRRTHEAEGLRAVTEIASQVAPLEETVEAVLIAVANLLESDVVAMGLVDEKSGDLVIAPDTVWGVPLEQPIRLDAYGPGFEDSVLIARRPLMSNALAEDERVLPAYRGLVAQFGMRNAIQVPLVVQDRCIGELSVANKVRGEDYTASDVDLLASIGTQVAAMIDRMQLYQATDQDLRARVQELDALGRVSHALSQTIELEHILDVIRQEALRSTGAAAASVVLLTDPEDWPLPGQPLIDRRYGEEDDLPDLAPVELAVALSGGVLRVDDYLTSEYEAAPPKARSALVVPVLQNEQPAGLIHLYSPRPAAFNQGVVDFALALTDQATIAIGNARRYQEQVEVNRQLRTRAERMGRVFELGEMFRQGASLAETLAELAHSIQETVGFNVVLISQVDEREGILRRTAQAGLPLAVFEEMRQITPTIEQARGLMQDIYRIGNSYFLPAEGSEALLAGVPIVQILQERMGAGPRAWDPQDLLLVPIYGTRGRMLGLISVDEPRSGRRPDLDTVEALEIFANQAAFSIENYRLITRIQQEAEATRRERDRLAQLHLVASEIQQAQDVTSRLQIVAEGIRQAGWGRVLITLRDEHLEPTAVIHAGYPPEAADNLAAGVAPGEVWRAWINDLAFHELKLGAGYYLRYDRPWVQEHALQGEDVERVAEDAWHPRDVVYLPLIGYDQKRIIGIIGMQDPADGRVPTETSLQPFELFASQAAAAIETTRLYQETVRAAEQEQRLNEVMEVVSGATTPEAVIEAIGRGLQQMAPFTRMSVALFDDETGRFDVLRADFAPDDSVTVTVDEPLDVDGTALGAAYRDVEARVYQLQRETRVREARADLRAWYASGEHTSLVVPMVAGGQVIGALRLGSEAENAPGFRANLEMVQRLANLSAVALENARLFEQVERRAVELNAQAQRLALVNRIATRVAQAITPGEIYQIALSEMQTVFGAQYGGLVIYENDQTGLLVLDTHPTAPQSGAVRLSLVDNPSTDTVRRTRRPVASEDVQVDPAFVQDRALLTERGTRALLIVPLIVAREVVGSIGIDFTEPRAFTDTEIELAETIASQASVALEKANLLAETAERASELNAQAQRLTILNRMSARLAQSLDPDEIYEMILTDLQRALGFQSAGLMLLEDNGLSRLVLSTHPQDAGAPADITIPLAENPVAAMILETQQPIVSPDVMRDPRFESMWDVLKQRNTRAMMIVPVIMGSQVIGTIGLDSTVIREFEDAEVELALTAANQAAVAIEKARLFTETQDRAVELDAQARRMALVNRVSTRLAETLDPEEIYAIVLTELAESLHVQLGGLVLFENEREGRLVLSYPLDQPTPDLKLNLQDNLSIEHVRETQRPLVSDDVLNDPLFEQAWDVLRLRGTRSLMTVPLVVGGQVIGTIGLDATEPRSFTDTEIELAMTIANQASVAIEKARLFIETQQRAVELDAQAKRMALVNRVSTRLAETLDPQQIYEIVLHELQDALRVDFSGLVLFEDEHTGRLVLGTHPDDSLNKNLTIPLENNPSIARVRETHKPLVSDDVLHDPVFEPAWDVLRQRGTRALMIVPLLVGENVVGTIGLDSKRRRVFSEAEIELAETIASQASLAVEKARLYTETLNLTIFNQAVVESIQQGIVVLDRDLVVRRVNSTMAEWYGWSNQAIGQRLFDYRSDYQDFLRQPIAVTLGMGVPQACDEVERLDPSGRPSIRNYYVYPMLEGHTVTGIVLLVEDVTERAMLRDDVNTRAIQMAALSEVSGQITSTLDPDQVINLILDALGRVLPYNGVSLWLRVPDRDELRIVAARGYNEPGSPTVDELIGLRVEIPFSPLFREMSEKAQVINVGDVSAGDPRFPYGSESAYKNWLGAPLISKGKVVGVLTVEKREPNFYTDLHQQLTLTFANQAAVALDNAQLFEETRARAAALDEQAQRLALLNRVSLALAQSLDLENILEIALRETAITLGVPEGSAIYIDNENVLGRIVVEYPRGDLPPDTVFDLTRNEAILRVRENWIPLVIEDVENDPLRDDLRALMRRGDVKSTLLVPLVMGGKVIGVLRLDVVDEPRAFTMEQIELAQTIASQAAIAVQNAALFEQSAARANELETLFESAQATAVTLDLNEVVRRVAQQMLAALRGDASRVFLWDDIDNTLIVHSAIGARPEDTPADRSSDAISLAEFPLRERALRDRELIIVRAEDKDLPPGEGELMGRHAAASRMVIPLVVNEVSIGLVEVETLDENRYFRADDVRMARTMASRAAIAIENARLQTETRRTVEELYIINDMSTALSSANSLDELLSVVATQLPSETDAQVIYVALYDRASDALSFPLAQSVLDERPLELASRALGKDEFSTILRRQAPLLLAGDSLDEARRNLGIETIMPEARCFLGVPLFAGDDVIGVLAVRDDADPRAFSHNDQRILTTVGAQLGVAIQSTRLFEQTLELAAVLDQRVRERTAELEEERHHISTLYQITTELATSLDMERLLNRALEMVAEAVGATQGAILAIDPASDLLHFRARLGWPEQAAGGSPEPAPLRVDEGLAGWAIQNRQAVVVENVQTDPRWLRLDEVDDLPRAALVALIEANEDILGVIMLYSDQAGAFRLDHVRLVSAAANQVANAMNNAELYSLIRDQAERLGALLRQEQVEATKSSAILDSVADGVMVADAAGQVIVFNSTAERILGLPADRVLNQPTSTVAGLYGAGTTRWAEAVERWMTDPAAYRPGDFLEERITLEDDRVISVRLSPVHMGDQFLGTVSIFRDITREVEVDRLKSEFVATVSHELRTPMTSIKGYADLLLLGAAGSISDQQQHFLETIKQNADRLSVLVNDLLDISRIDQGRMELRFSLVDIKSVLEMVSEHVQGRSKDEKRPMNVVVEPPEDQGRMVWGDYDKVARIVTNLADNAFSYTPEGGTITLGASFDAESGHAIITVADTGIGIPPDVADRVYERFVRGNETQDLVMDTPGTGLGLSIVRELVEMHNGRIWFDSEVDVGTTFYVVLPARAVEAAGGEKAAVTDSRE